MRVLHVVATPRQERCNYTLMSGQPLDSGHEASWRQIEALVPQFLGVDAYVLSVPMRNFGIPSALKYYIDCVVQPDYVFRYDDGGEPTPLMLGKKHVQPTDISALARDRPGDGARAGAVARRLTTVDTSTGGGCRWVNP
jgi:FMN-dependent NADH-azoreductase